LDAKSDFKNLDFEWKLVHSGFQDYGNTIIWLHNIEAKSVMFGSQQDFGFWILKFSCHPNGAIILENSYRLLRFQISTPYTCPESLY
jgi:hypothetical protein